MAQGSSVSVVGVMRFFKAKKVSLTSGFFHMPLHVNLYNIKCPCGLLVYFKLIQKYTYSTILNSSAEIKSFKLSGCSKKNVKTADQMEWFACNRTYPNKAYFEIKIFSLKYSICLVFEESWLNASKFYSSITSRQTGLISG